MSDELGKVKLGEFNALQHGFKSLNKYEKPRNTQNAALGHLSTRDAWDDTTLRLSSSSQWLPSR